MNKFDQIMLDTETFSTNPNASIIQIAAVKFSFDHDETEAFCMNVNPKSCVDRYGAHVEKDTVAFWFGQPTEVKNSIFSNQVDIEDALNGLNTFIGNHPRAFDFWIHRSHFDYPIIKHAYIGCDMKSPIPYYNVFDTSTTFRLASVKLQDFERVGNEHNALDDCFTQIKALKEVLGNET